MICRRTVIALLIGTAAGAGFTVALSHSRLTLRAIANETRSLTAGIQMLVTERSGLRTDIADLPSNEPPESPAQPFSAQELRATLSQILAKRQNGPPRPSGHPYPQSAQGDIFPELLADAEYLRHYMSYESLTVELRYADFFATTSARPEAVEKLKHALVHRSIGALEREELIARHGVPAGDRAELSHFLQLKFDAEVREILDDSGFAKFKQYEQTLIQRTAVTAFAERLSYSDQPLTSGQAAELITLMASTTEPYGKTQIPAQRFTDDMINRAASILSAPQLEEMKRFQNERDAAKRR